MVVISNPPLQVGWGDYDIKGESSVALVRLGVTLSVAARNIHLFKSLNEPVMWR